VFGAFCGRSFGASAGESSPDFRAVAGIRQHTASYSNVMGRTGVTPGVAAAGGAVNRGTVLATKAARKLSAAQ